MFVNNIKYHNIQEGSIDQVKCIHGLESRVALCESILLELFDL